MKQITKTGNDLGFETCQEAYAAIKKSDEVKTGSEKKQNFIYSIEHLEFAELKRFIKCSLLI